MKFTGERFIDNHEKNWPIYLQHVSRYLFAQKSVCNKVVLDASCGSGYGTNMLALTAKHVLGIDISDEAIRYCKNRYEKHNAYFAIMNCLDLGLHNEALDMLVSFETIEHLSNPKKFVSEAYRTLKPGGTFLVSTPNKPMYLFYNMGKQNEFHPSEMTLPEFNKLLSQYFDKITLFGQGYFTYKDATLLSKKLKQSIPTGRDHIAKKVTRVLLRTLFSEKKRSNFFLKSDIWSNRWDLGAVPPDRAIYLIALCIK